MSIEILFASTVSIEVADLQNVAERFQALTVASEPAAKEAFLEAVTEDQLERVARSLAAGSPTAALEVIDEVAAEIKASSTLDPARLPSLTYWSALTACIRWSDLDQIAAGLEGGEADHEPLQEQLGNLLLPLTGLDLAGATHYARVFMDNFPQFSLPLGDVDERATRWLAQLLDMGSIRSTLRDALREVAAAWERDRPGAAAVVRGWAESPMPADQTQDLPWMRALLPLARTQM